MFLLRTVFQVENTLTSSSEHRQEKIISSPLEEHSRNTEEKPTLLVLVSYPAARCLPLLAERVIAQTGLGQETLWQSSTSVIL